MSTRESTREVVGQPKSTGSMEKTRGVGVRVPPAISFLIALGIVLSGCEEDSSITAPEEPVNSTVTEAMTQGIQLMISASNAAWSNMDAAGYASFYAEDTEVINPIGGTLSGREAFQATHAFLFNGPFRGSTHSSTIRKITPLTGSLLIVDLTVDLTGFAFLPPNGLRETAPGLVRTSDRLIVERRQNGWEILAQQMTPVPPAP